MESDIPAPALTTGYSECFNSVGYRQLVKGDTLGDIIEDNSIFCHIYTGMPADTAYQPG